MNFWRKTRGLCFGAFSGLPLRTARYPCPNPNTFAPTLAPNTVRDEVYLLILTVFSSFSRLLYRTRHGACAGTVDAITNVRKCARKGCLFSGLPIQEQFSVDSIGQETGLRLNHKRIGTGKNESLHRCAKAGRDTFTCWSNTVNTDCPVRR